MRRRRIRTRTAERPQQEGEVGVCVWEVGGGMPSGLVHTSERACGSGPQGSHAIRSQDEELMRGVCDPKMVGGLCGIRGVTHPTLPARTA